HRVSRERGPELHAAGVGELVVPGHNARIEGHAQHAASRDVGALDRLRDEASPARQGGAGKQKGRTKGSHQQNGTRRVADAVFATPSHEGSSCSGHGGNRPAVFLVVGVPACACARSPNPYAKLTSTASPPGEAQFPATVNGAGANALLAATLNHVEPREKCGGTTLLLRCPNPTAMSSAPCAPAASMESSTSEYCTRKAAVSVASVVSPAWAAPSSSLL